MTKLTLVSSNMGLQSEGSEVSVIVFHNHICSNVQFCCPGRSKTARCADLIPFLFSERFSENDSEHTRVEPWLDMCTAA